MLALTIAASALAAPKPDRPPDPTDRRIQRARDKTHACQGQLGLGRSPVSDRPIYGRRYQRWVLALWQARADAYCGVVRQLYGTRGSSTLRSIAGPCLSEIIDRETAGTWNPQVYNHQGSGAYGLPQALPGHKMASAGADWRTNPLTQLRWMRGYTRGRYGSECGALSFHNANGWY